MLRAPWPADLTVMLIDLADPFLLNRLPYLSRRLFPFSSSSSVSLPLSMTSSLFFDATLRRLDAVLWWLDAVLWWLECRLEVVLIFDAVLLLVDARLDLPLSAVDRLDLPLLVEPLLLFPEL